MAKAKVAIVRTKPETVLDDTIRVFGLGGGNEAMEKKETTILKDNISWHYPFPSANTTPWQLEGTILALRQNGFEKVTCVQNKTEVTKAEMGGRAQQVHGCFRSSRHRCAVQLQRGRYDLGSL